MTTHECCCEEVLIYPTCSYRVAFIDNRNCWRRTVKYEIVNPLEISPLDLVFSKLFFVNISQRKKKESEMR